MLKSKLPLLRFTKRCATRYPGYRLQVANQRYHSTTTSEIEPPQEQSKENNTETSTEKIEGTDVTKSKATQELKRPICLDLQSSKITDPEFRSVNSSSSSSPSSKPSKQYFKHIQLPSVASTQHLDTLSLKLDIFYKGFRPLLTPVERPIIKNFHRKPTIPLRWNNSACKVQTFDDFSKIPQFVVDTLIPYNEPPLPGNEIRLGNKSRKEIKHKEKLSKEVLEFIRHFEKFK